MQFLPGKGTAEGPEAEVHSFVRPEATPRWACNIICSVPATAVKRIFFHGSELRGTIGAMESLDRPSDGADSAGPHRRRQIDAQFRLLTLDNFETVARHYETMGAAEYISTADAGARTSLAAHYQKAVGVAVEQRHQLRRLLEQAAVSGDDSIEEVVQRVRGQSRNGLSSSSDSADSTAEDWL